jgi:hypothetical protein
MTTFHVGEHERPGQLAWQEYGDDRGEQGGDGYGGAQGFGATQECADLPAGGLPDFVFHDAPRTTNGRVDVQHGYQAPFAHQSQYQTTSPQSQYQTSSEAAMAALRASLQHQIEATPLSSLFFSGANLDALQQAIRYEVHLATHKVIARQSDAEVAQVMRYIYLSHARHLLDVRGECRALNRRVLDYCVPRVAGELDAWLHFRRDISQMPVPLDRGQLATSKGERSLPGATPWV